MKRDRLNDIVDYIRIHTSVSTQELAEFFNTSDMTIRRDLATLEAQGKVSRYHGGASIIEEKKDEAAFSLRMQLNEKEKQAIGQYAVNYLQSRITADKPTSVFLSSGSTVYWMSKLLPPGIVSTIITDNVYVSSVLAADERNSVVMIGGQLILPSLNATGYIAEKNLSEFNIDIAFIGSSAIDEKGNLYAFHLMEAGIFSMIIEKSRNIVVLADHSKFGHKNLVQITGINENFTIITDEKTPADYIANCRQRGAKVLVCSV